jgi:uroporphyrinogen-III synthase
LADARALAGVRLAAVGRATAGALADRQLVADLVAEPATAEGLVASMPAAPAEVSGAAVLYPRAGEVRPTVADGLRAKGWAVEEVVAYRTVSVAERLPASALDEASRADVITFTSPSTVRAYLAAAPCVPPVVACIGPATAEAARRAGLEVTVVADEHGVEGLVRAVLAATGS